MAAVLKCELQCDGCATTREGQFNSVAEARDAAWKDGWATHRLVNRIFDFCGACQAEEKKEEQKRLGKTV